MHKAAGRYSRPWAALCLLALLLCPSPAPAGPKPLLVGVGAFAPQDYGMALPPGSPLREPKNRILLAMAEDGRLERIRNRWFGDDK